MEEAQAEALEEAVVPPSTAISERCETTVNRIAGRVSRRSAGALIRNSFVRPVDPESASPAPLSVLASTRGRGAGVPLKLYLGLLWLSATPPYDTNLPAAKWAEALDLEEPDTKGARRVGQAEKRLAKMKLIDVQRQPGEPNRVSLLQEDGSGKPYVVPHASYRTGRDRDEHLYFKFPTALWTSGHVQNMSSAALAMLLVVLEESRGKTTPQWWSVSTFDKRFNLSKDVRARGTGELAARGLVGVNRVPVGIYPGFDTTLTAKKMRNTYTLINEAAGP